MAKQQLAVTTEPSLDRVKVDVYRPYPLIGAYPSEAQVIGGYAIPAIKVRMPVNAPGVLRNDFVGHLANTWDGPSTIWSAPSQGKQYPMTGGAVAMPLNSYQSQVMMTTPPPQNRAAFTAAVQRFLATRGNRSS
jgi:hypothetical protein